MLAFANNRHCKASRVRFVGPRIAAFNPLVATQPLENGIVNSEQVVKQAIVAQRPASDRVYYHLIRLHIRVDEGAAPIFARIWRVKQQLLDGGKKVSIILMWRRFAQLVDRQRVE